MVVAARERHSEIRLGAATPLGPTLIRFLRDPISQLTRDAKDAMSSHKGALHARYNTLT